MSVHVRLSNLLDTNIASKTLDTRMSVHIRVSNLI